MFSKNLLDKCACAKSTPRKIPTPFAILKTRTLSKNTIFYLNYSKQEVFMRMFGFIEALSEAKCGKNENVYRYSAKIGEKR